MRVSDGIQEAIDAIDESYGVKEFITFNKSDDYTGVVASILDQDGDYWFLYRRYHYDHYIVEKRCISGQVLTSTLALGEGRKPLNT